MHIGVTRGEMWAPLNSRTTQGPAVVSVSSTSQGWWRGTRPQLQGHPQRGGEAMTCLSSSTGPLMGGALTRLPYQGRKFSCPKALLWVLLASPLPLRRACVLQLNPSRKAVFRSALQLDLGGG